MRADRILSETRILKSISDKINDLDNTFHKSLS